jgi:pimeloyl-ACP methyl ester carboxylesterase
VLQRRAEPEWARRVATAPTVAREARAEQEWTYAGNPMDRITTPTLLLSGSDSPPDIRHAAAAARAAIPGARARVLAGRGHGASHRSCDGGRDREGVCHELRRSCSIANSVAAARVEWPILV